MKAKKLWVRKIFYPRKFFILIKAKKLVAVQAVSKN